MIDYKRGITVEKEQLEFLKLTLLEMKKHISHLEAEIKLATQNERRDQTIRKIRSQKRNMVDLFRFISSLPSHEMEHLFKTLPKYHGIKDYKKEFQKLNPKISSGNLFYKILYGPRFIRFLNAIFKVPTPEIDSLKRIIQKRKQWPTIHTIDKWIASIEKAGSDILTIQEYREIKKCPNMPKKVREGFKLWLEKNNKLYQNQCQKSNVVESGELDPNTNLTIVKTEKEKYKKENQYLEDIWSLMEVIKDIEELKAMLPRKEYKHYIPMMIELLRRQKLKLSTYHEETNAEKIQLEIEKLQLLENALNQNSNSDSKDDKAKPYFLLYALTDHGNSIFAQHLMGKEVAEEYYDLIERSLYGLQSGLILKHQKKIRKFKNSNHKLHEMYEVKDKKIRIYFRILEQKYIMIYALRFKDTDKSMTDMAIIMKLVQSLEPQIKQVKNWIQNGNMNEYYLEKNREIHTMVLEHLRNQKRGKKQYRIENKL